MAFGMILSGGAAWAATGPAHLLRDINPTPSSNRGSFPERYQRLGNIALFQASTPQTGEELWRTDGTEAGTFLVKDINPGRSSSFFYPAVSPPDDPFVELGGALIFLADDGAHGLYSFELWRSDGTEAGTRMVKKIRPDSQSSFLAPAQGNDIVIWKHMVAGGTLYFLANDGVHGFELWRTDGTEAGTFLLKDIFPGPRGAFGDNYFFIHDLVGQEAGGSFFFRTNDGIHRDQLWKTDGTSAGTVLIHPGADVSAPGNFTELNGNFLFTAYNGDSGSGLWRSDGTQAGTVQITAATPWPFQTYPFGLIKANGTVYFGIIDGWLYRTDGTSGGTVPVRQFASEVSPLREWDGSLLFMADDGIHGNELWRSDGTAGGTVLVKDIVSAPASYPGFFRFTEAAGRLFFFADDGVHGLELWATDATEAGTFLVKDITPGSAGSNPYDLLGVEGTLFFFITEADYPNALRLWKSDGTEVGTRAVQSPPAYYDGIGLQGNFLFGANDVIHGFELWRSDGTDAGTTLVKDIHPSFVTDSSNAQFIGVVSVPGFGERMFFRADDGVHGMELWVSDGTASGTRLVKDIGPGMLSSDPSPGIAHDGALFFAATDDAHGFELWKSDGTEAGTVLVDDILPGLDSGMGWDSSFGELGDFVYFGADDGTHGRTLWKSDGTKAGTVQVAGIDLTSFLSSPGSTSPIYPITIGGTLYFLARDPVHGAELWKSDGTETGTVLVRDLYPGSASSGSSMFTDLHGSLFMIAQDPVHGFEPWLSDGTEAGTYLIKDIFPGRTASHRRFVRPVVLGDSVYFPAQRDPAHGEALWKSDGTEAGTVLVKDVSGGSLTLFDGNLFFFSSTGLWKSDGTEEGTHVVKTGLAMTADLKAVDGGLLFASTDSDHGNELWRSDGTESGSVLVQDIFPGPDSSIPGNFTPLGNKILFMADDGAAGPEPWFARTAILFGRPDRAIEDLKGEVKLLRLPRGIETSLSAILNAAAKHLSANQTTQAIVLLETFARYLGSLSPGKVSEASAADLQEFTAEIVGLLEGSLKPAVPSERTAPEIPAIPPVPGGGPARMTHSGP